MCVCVSVCECVFVYIFLQLYLHHHYYLHECIYMYILVFLIFVELGVSEGTISMLRGLYESNKDTIINHLEVTGIALPELIGVDWRLDYGIRSKHGGRGNLPMFFVNLKLKDRGLVRDVEMICSQEELEDMLSKVKDAVKQTERLLSAGQSSSAGGDSQLS